MPPKFDPSEVKVRFLLVFVSVVGFSAGPRGLSRDGMGLKLERERRMTGGILDEEMDMS